MPKTLAPWLLGSDRLLDGNHLALNDGPAPESKSFVTAIAVPGGQQPATVVVTLESQEIARVTASVNPPTVAITSPTGATITNETIPIAWTAGDLDGDNVTTTVLLSVDSGIKITVRREESERGLCDNGRDESVGGPQTQQIVRPPQTAPARQSERRRAVLT